MSLFKIEYDYNAIKLSKLFEHPCVQEFSEKGIECEESISVFGNIRFPRKDERVYLMASFVTSVDGKIAFLDDPAGPVIAKSNKMDQDGATADFWLLNLFRASADAIFVGAGTMIKEPDGTAHIFDQKLEDKRVECGMAAVPWAVICSLDGDIRFEDYMFKAQPCMINTSPVGYENVKEKMKQPYYLVGPYESIDEIDEALVIEDFNAYKDSKVPVIVSGNNDKTNSEVVLRILKLMGINRAMVESPSYCHSLMNDKLLDEILLNYSCIYVGGNAVGFGKDLEPFTSTRHPHTELLSVHMHSPSFLYFRHKLNYNHM